MLCCVVLLSCAADIAEYVGDHRNWQRPIIPGDEQCEQLEFQPERFDWVSNMWICSGSLNDAGKQHVDMYWLS